MQSYTSKEALVEEIQKRYVLFDKEFETISEDKKDHCVDGVDRTPQEMIAYQLGWLTLIMGWERDELANKAVVTPTPDYKWNQLGLLYQNFYRQYSNYSLEELRQLFHETVEKWCDWIKHLSDEELFTPNMRKWTVTNANWPMWKWIHINSVAPFKSFRTKIRKWKKNL
ncbi:ClbS/DfsB family four-helix bundle protein [Sporolactobacillus sp. STCC-11]|uniref:ClbS/DfsB family four-helix bundle protein n=1 Tax=Sporolactobacillus caesalpiniae TaxID=3230362 RepID=UPI00339AAA63